MNNLGKIFKDIARNKYYLSIYGFVVSSLQGHWNDEFEATEIIDNLWVGNMCSASNKDKLVENNVNTIVIAAIGVRELFPDTFKYINVPLRDVDDEPIINHIEEILPTIHELLLQNKGVLVHCMFGASRSVSIVACYLIKYHNMSAEQAIDFMKSKRSQVNPNEGYKQCLHMYEKIIHQKQNV